MTTKGGSLDRHITQFQPVCDNFHWYHRHIYMYTLTSLFKHYHTHTRIQKERQTEREDVWTRLLCPMRTELVINNINYLGYFRLCKHWPEKRTTGSFLFLQSRISHAQQTWQYFLFLHACVHDKTGPHAKLYKKSFNNRFVLIRLAWRWRTRASWFWAESVYCACAAAHQCCCCLKAFWLAHPQMNVGCSAKAWN